MNDLIERLTIMWRTGEFDHRTVGDAIDRIEQLEDRLEVYSSEGVRLGENCDGIACRDETIKCLDKRIEQLEKIMRGILAVDPDFGHGSAIVRNIQKMVRAVLPEDRE